MTNQSSKQDSAARDKMSEITLNEIIHTLTKSDTESMALEFPVRFDNEENRSSILEFMDKLKITNKGISFVDLNQDGLKTGFFTGYNQKGNKVEVANYVADLLEGPYKFYDEKGTLKKTEFFKNGKNATKIVDLNLKLVELADSVRFAV